jgi:hypothetical protein
MMSSAWFFCPQCRAHFWANEAAGQDTIVCPECKTVVRAQSDQIESSWFCAKGKQKLGPFSWTELQERARSGELQQSDMVLQKGAPKWVSADSVSDLFRKDEAALPQESVSSSTSQTATARSAPLPRRRMLWAIVAAGVAAAVVVVVMSCGLLVFALRNAGTTTKHDTAQSKREKKTQPDRRVGKQKEKEPPEVKNEPKETSSAQDSSEKIAASDKTAGDPKGLTSVMFNGTEFLHRGEPQVRYVILEQNSFDGSGFKQYKFDKVAETPRKVDFDSRSKTYTQKYSWGSASVQYEPGKDQLDCALTIHNQSSRTIANFEITLLDLAFPALPATWEKGQALLKNSLDDLAISEAYFSKGKLVACNSTIEPPMWLGFENAVDKGNLVYPLVVKGGVYVPGPGASVMEPHGLPRIPPDKSLTMRTTLRFGPAEMPVGNLLEDVVQRFREFHSPQLRWKDRRPIARIIRSSGAAEHVSKANPRGWMNNPKLDITTAEGKAEFRKAMLKEAEQSVKVIKDTGGQGMIFWDVEGQENPHPISFIGDPRLAKRMAPEMDEIADAYFKVFRDAGLRTGVCIRPTQVYFDDEQKQWSHGTGSDGGPGRGSFYPELRPKDQPWWKFYPLAERLSDRIEFAKKRWGCTLFYIDTNGVFRQSGQDQEFRWYLVNAAVWKQVQAKHPDVLLIPELARDDQTFHLANWAHSATYMEIRGQGYRTPDYVRAFLPDAFSVVVITDGDLDSNRSEIKAGVARGDILMFNGWFDDDRNAWVKALYKEVSDGK